MYERLFGFKERPFKLVPNPAYLYLSPSHEDALAHLTYAIDQGDGFVLITGEVGTGKTTLCRVFLEGLTDTTEAAYIFNPKLTAIGLLQTINSEFGLPATSENAAELTAALNSFLIQRREAGRKALILVDEAQNLDHSVLEQLRLLSNLETTTSKLLQIVLVGQPELGHLLESHDLRQLNQRITLSCHLRPLTGSETRGYISHRLQVAAQRPLVVFSAGALRHIFTHTGGVPRLVNILCDRALLVAYGRKSRSVSAKMIREAVAEMTTGAMRPKEPLRLWRWVTALVIGVLVVTGLWMGVSRMGGGNGQGAPVHAIKVPETATDGEPLTGSSPENFLAEMAAIPSREASIVGALERWQVLAPIPEPINRIGDDSQYFQQASAAHGLNLMVRRGDLAALVRLNLPAILPLNRMDGTLAGYALLDRIEDQQILLRTDPKRPPVTLSPDRLNGIWDGWAYIPWRDFYGCRGLIPGDAPARSIRRLKRLLADIGVTNLPDTSEYDPATRAAVMAFQRRYGINPDGIVGPATKIVLYNALETLTTPGLVAPASDPSDTEGGIS